MAGRFQTFVAFRYLVADPWPHVSKLAVAKVLFFLTNAVWMSVVIHYALTPPDPRALIPTGSPHYEDWVIARNVQIGLAGFTAYVLAVRMFFTFYSTVSIVGLSIGSAALVIVLSVMNGFETDLRDKILGSNAHVQISKEDGEFTEWEVVRERIRSVPDVVASTAFATSEVVIAANSNYFNVVVKGIDTATAVKVTNLERSLITQGDEPDPEALARLEPLIKEDAEAPALEPTTPPSGDVVDPPPADMQVGGEPIDYSGGDEDEPAPPPSPPDGGEPAAHDEHLFPTEPPPPPPPEADAEPADAPQVIEVGRRRLGSRVSTLDGVLAGKELFKQIHLFTNQEVRLVSPLADPMNPDANGTPIPFNRDYRVAGTFYTGMYEYDLKLVYVSLESLQEFLRMGDAVDGIEVRIADPDTVDSVVAAIARELGPAYRVQGWQELNRNLFSALKLEKIAMFLVLAIIVLVASFSIVGTLIVTVVEKGKEIALIKTLGASDGGIVGVFVMQGLSIGVIGTLLGVSIGVAGSAALARFGFPLNPDVYYIDRLPIEIDPLTVALVFAAGIVISVAATIYPAILAAQLRPAQGLKM